MRDYHTGKYLAACNAAYSMIRNRSGYSANIDTLEEPKDGYMVAIKTLKIYPNISSVNVHEVSGLLRQECNKLYEDIFIGVWKNPESGEIYFEISVNKSKIEDAIKVGNLTDQKYIFDVKSNQDIKL